jgi:hypothetical protein
MEKAKKIAVFTAKAVAYSTIAYVSYCAFVVVAVGFLM